MYTVASGDTLQAIAESHHLDYRDIAKWNHLADPDRITTGQPLRLTAP